MNFNSWQYLVYLPTVILGYYLLPHKFRWIWLLLASYFFYFSWSYVFGGLIFLTTAVSYGFSLLIERHPKKKKLFLVFTLIICLGILAVFKYLQFAYDSIILLLNLFGLKLSSFDFHLILPVGISFYTFQTLSYVIDVYRGDFKAEHHFGYYALFISYFPQLVAGPIEKPQDLLPQLKAEHHFCKEDLLSGTRLLLLGFFRKCCIADICGIFVDNIFNQIEQANSLTVLLGGLLFCFQMYGDFAGYSEIAMGSSKLLGINLTQNFNKPYTSLTYGEFFHRWHYSLNRWFTEYLYIPLGGNRKGKIRKIRNIFIVFALCGLWHGARWTYVLWGLYAAFWISFESLFLKKILDFLNRHKIPTDSCGFVLLRHILILFIFVIAAIFFRAINVREAFLALQILFTRFDNPVTMLNQALSISKLSVLTIAYLGCALFLMDRGYDFAYHKTNEIFKNSQEKERAIQKNALIYLGFLLCILICWIGLVSTDSSSSFAYFQF